jgi:hypothetical protein
LLALMVFVQIANYPRDVTILVIVIGVSTLLGQFALPMKSALNLELLRANYSPQYSLLSYCLLVRGLLLSPLF